MKSLFTASVVVCMLLGCNEQGNTSKLEMPPPQWDSASRLSFIDACVEEQNSVISDTIAYAYCKCMLEQLETRFSQPDSASLIDSATLLQLQQNCVGK